MGEALLPGVYREVLEESKVAVGLHKVGILCLGYPAGTCSQLDPLLVSLHVNLHQQKNTHKTSATDTLLLPLQFGFNLNLGLGFILGLGSGGRGVLTSHHDKHASLSQAVDHEQEKCQDEE